MSEESRNEKLNIVSRVIFTVLVTILAAISIWKLFVLMVADQHVIYADADFFNMINLIRQAFDNGYSAGAILRTGDVTAWGIVVGYACNMLGQDPVVFCHNHISMTFFASFIVIYAMLAVRLFKRDGKGIWHIYNSVCSFLFIVIWLCINGYYSEHSVEAGVLVKPWYGITVAGMLITPLVITTILRFSDGIRKCIQVKSDPEAEEKSNESSEETEPGKRSNRRVKVFRLVILITTCILAFVLETLGYIVCATYDNATLLQNSTEEESGIAYFYDTYFDYKWVLFLAIAMLIYAIVAKKKAWIPVVLGVAISAAFLTPLPLAVVIGYGAVKISINEKKESIWTVMALLCFGFMFYMMGRVEGTDVQREFTFEKAENPFKIPQDAIDIADYILDENNTAGEKSVTTYEYMYYAIGQYSPYVTCRKFSDGRDSQMNAAIYFNEGRISSYTLIHNTMEITTEELENEEYGIVKVFEDYTLYAKTGWVETDAGWMHTAGDGSEYLGEGWHTIRGAKYHFDASGVVQTGFNEIDGNVYYLLESGGMLLYWQQIGEDWYYFDENGIMQHDCEIEGYTLRPDGVCEDY